MKARVTLLPFYIFICLSGFAQQQSSFFPKNLGTPVNTTYHEINPVISPDGKTLFFTRVNHPGNYFGERNSQDIWVSQLMPDGSWSEPKNVYELNIGRYNSVLYMAPDGNTVLLHGEYNWRSTFWYKRGLSKSYRIDNNTWSEPEMMIVRGLTRKNRGMKSSASLSADGKVLLLSFSNIHNSERSNLYVSTLKRNGWIWTKPKRIKSLNTRYSEDTPFLSADNNTLYFASDRAQKGQYDIYQTTRKGAAWEWDQWSEPVLFKKDTLNSPEWESFFKVNAKGSWGFFSSTKDSNGGADIYKIKLFEENPFVIVSGKIINQTNQRTMNPGLFRIFADDKPVDSVKLNQVDQTYTISLPLGKKYTVHAATDHYTFLLDTIDVARVREFTEMNKDLQVKPFPYVLVKGKLLIKNSTEPINASSRAKIYVDNLLNDSAQVNWVNSTYTMKLKHGHAYNLQVRANKYEAVPYLLDLTAVNEYQELNVDLFADPEKMAIVRGNIYDKKTNRLLAPTAALKLKVEGLQAIVVTLDTLRSSYELKLPLGNTYTISAQAPNYYPMYEMVTVVHERGDIRIYKDLYIAPIEVGQTIKLNNIFFETAKTILKTESFPELDRVVEFLNASPDIKIEIAGHTDNVGKADYNKRLSQGRAQSVTNYIISKGIATDRIVAKGYGMDKPVATNKTATGKAQNRRVEFTILDK